MLLDWPVTELPFYCKTRKQLKLFFLDRPDRVAVMGQPLVREKQGFVYLIPDVLSQKAMQQKKLIIEVEYADVLIGFLRGDFLVRNQAPYRRKDDRQRIVEGGFYLTDSHKEQEEVDCTDLLTAGYPFCGSYVSVSAWVVAGEDGRFSLGAVRADCAEVLVDGEMYGPVWGPPLDKPISVQW